MIFKVIVTALGIASLLWGIVEHGIFRMIMGALLIIWGWWL